jgi:hypothetical protein
MATKANWKIDDSDFNKNYVLKEETIYASINCNKLSNSDVYKVTTEVCRHRLWVMYT